MYAISTAVFVAVLALFSSLAIVVQANGPRPQCIETYNVTKGETCNTLGGKLAANQSDIMSMNPGIRCNTTLPVDKPLCTMAYQPVCTLNETATSKTCDHLASKWNITKLDFVNYNDNVNDNCTDLVTGKPYCVSIDGCYPGSTLAVCG